MAAMITSGLMFFSRLIASICWRSWLAMTPLRVPAAVGGLRALPFHFEPALHDLRERHREGAALRTVEGEHAVLHGRQAAGDLRALPRRQRLAEVDAHETRERPPEIRFRREGPVQSRGRHFEGVA